MSKVNFYWSYPLQVSFLKSNFDYKLVETFRKEFNNYFRKYEKRIVELIKKYTGKELTKPIDVWLQHSFYPTILDPPILNIYNGDKQLTLFHLIRILIFQVLKKELKRKPKKFVDATTYGISLRIISNLFSERTVKNIIRKTEENGFKKYIWDEWEKLKILKFQKGDV